MTRINWQLPDSNEFVWSRRKALEHIWILHKSEADCRMGRLMELDELIERLRICQDRRPWLRGVATSEDAD